MKKVLAFLLAAVMVFALCACGGSTGGTTAAPKEYSFTTGGDQGTYYGFGGVLAQKITEKTGTKVTAITSGGSKANIENLQAGDAQFGFVQSDVMAYGYQGSRLFEETGAVSNFSTVAALYMEQVQIVTLNPDIKTVADLKGKTVSIGAAGSGVYFNAIDVLGVYGLSETDINPTYQSFGDSVEALQDGKIDAAFVVAGAPTPAVTDLATSKYMYLVSLDDEHVAKLQEISGAYTKSIIAAGTYAKQDADVATVGVKAIIIANGQVSEDQAYTIVKTIFEGKDNIAHDKAKELDLEYASTCGLPYHAGAAKYFAEQGITVETANP